MSDLIREIARYHELIWELAIKELRGEKERMADALVSMTRAMAFKAGWNGWWMDNLARPANMVDYHVTETSFLGIKADHNRQSAFINGLVLGVEFNR